jgi:thiol-disulfide isomerase/thioredoxin
MTFMDQHGEMVDLYSFCGKHVMVLISAGWCGPCRSLAEEVQAIQDEYRDEGLQIIEMITDDNSYEVPSQGFLESWAEQYGFEDIPVLSIPAPTSYDSPHYLFDADGYIPSVYHLNTSMKVVSADESVHDPGTWL